MSKGFIQVHDQHSKIFGHRILNSQLSLYLGILQLIVTLWALIQHIFSMLALDKILHCDFTSNSTLPPLLTAVDAIIFDIGLFHSLWGIHGCVAQHLDGGYGRFAWCICHTLALMFCLPFAFVARPKPHYLWPLLIQQSAYGIGLLILSLAALPRVLPTLMGDLSNAPLHAIVFYLIGTVMNMFLLYIYWHWYWYVESMWDSAKKIRNTRLEQSHSSRTGSVRYPISNRFVVPDFDSNHPLACNGQLPVSNGQCLTSPEKPNVVMNGHTNPGKVNSPEQYDSVVTTHPNGNLITDLSPKISIGNHTSSGIIELPPSISSSSASSEYCQDVKIVQNNRDLPKEDIFQKTSSQPRRPSIISQVTNSPGNSVTSSTLVQLREPLPMPAQVRKLRMEETYGLPPTGRRKRTQHQSTGSIVSTASSSSNASSIMGSRPAKPVRSKPNAGHKSSSASLGTNPKRNGQNGIRAPLRQQTSLGGEPLTDRLRNGGHLIRDENKIPLLRPQFIAESAQVLRGTGRRLPQIADHGYPERNVINQHPVALGPTTSLDYSKARRIIQRPIIVHPRRPPASGLYSPPLICSQQSDSFLNASTPWFSADAVMDEESLRKIPRTSLHWTQPMRNRVISSGSDFTDTKFTVVQQRKYPFVYSYSTGI
ncbi:hypothetical protein Ddc_03492 [Ditylenchus destructor]|nr:hypothetical protein Ddc_03492 [Ditylenchus destructor]